jgi:hypothetical protein
MGVFEPKIRVIHNQHDLLGLRKIFVHQLLYLFRPILAGLLCSVMPARLQPSRGAINMNMPQVPFRSG